MTLLSSQMQKKIPSIDIHPCMQALYMDKCVDISTVTHWVQQFEQEVGEAGLCDQKRSGRPETATDESHEEHV
jgi:transposase